MSAGLDTAPARVGSVYVHAPFCARRCLYCDFAVAVRKTGDLPAWIEALTGELAYVGREGLVRLADRLETVYVGGGTPSLLGPSAMFELASVLGSDRLADPNDMSAPAALHAFSVLFKGVPDLVMGVEALLAEGKESRY